MKLNARSLLAALVVLFCVTLSLQSQVGIDATGAQFPIKHNVGVNLNDPITSFSSVEDVLEQYIPKDKLEQVKRVVYGQRPGNNYEVNVPENVSKYAEEKNFDVKHYSLTSHAIPESLRGPRHVRIGVIQHQIVKPTNASILEQYEAIEKRVGEMIDVAGQLGVQVLALQEAWTMPFAFCTREKRPWLEFAEDPQEGRSTQFLKKLARKYRMVIVSPILERDRDHADTIWNTAVIIGHTGNYIGKHRKNHIPRVGDFNEATYYLEGNTGHPVFETAYGRIGVNICYGRHHPLNWLGFALNGAEIVFNPSATVVGLSEPMWPVEARNAAIANSYFTAAINRVGTEHFPHAFTSGDKKPAHSDFGHFYGSSYVAGPDGARTPGLSRIRDGLLVTDLDLNQVQQVRDTWMFHNTARYPMYARTLTNYVKHDFKPQIIRDPALNDNKSEQVIPEQAADYL